MMNCMSFSTKFGQLIIIQEQSLLLRNWYNLMQKHNKDLSIIITAKSGKPLSESTGEIAYGSSFIEWFADEAKRIMASIQSILRLET